MKQFLLIFSLLVATLLGCQVETAQSESRPTLVIASDYLRPADTAYFSNFAKSANVKIEIIRLTADQLIGRFRNFGDNHEVDVIMMQSLNEVYTMNRAQILQRTASFLPELGKATYGSKKSNYVGFGADPFVCVTRNDTTLRINDYNALHSTPFVNALERDSYVIMLAPVVKELKRVKGFNWTKEIERNSVSTKHIQYTDSLRASTILCSYSEYASGQFKDSIYNAFTNVQYPQTFFGGTLFDMRTMCIAKHTEEYEQSKAFIRYYSDSKHRLQLNKKLETFAIPYEGQQLYLYQSDLDAEIEYIPLVNRMLNTIRQ